MQINNSFSVNTSTFWATVNNTKTNTSKGDYLSESTQKVIGIIICFFSVLGVAVSITVLNIVLTKIHHLNSSTVFIPVLAIVGFIVSAFLMPLHAATAFDNSVIFGENGCMLYGYTFTSIGLLFITLLTAMVVQLYRVIVTAHTIEVELDKKCFILMLGGCILLCGIASAFPLFRKAAYEPYRRPSLCHMRWIRGNQIDIVYYISLLLLFFVLPTVLISASYTVIYFKTKDSSSRSFTSTRNRHRHLFMLKTFIIITGAFILTWSPYVVCVIMDLAGVDYHSYSHDIYLFCSMVAKVSLTWTPAIFIFRHSYYRNDLEIMANEMIEKDEKLTTSSGEYNLDSVGMSVEEQTTGKIEFVADDNDRIDSIPSHPVLLSYNSITESDI